MKVRCLYGLIVEDSEVEDRVLFRALKDIDALVLCCPERDELSEFNNIGMSFLKKEQPQRHTEQSTLAEKREVIAKAAESRSKPGAARDATQPSNLLAQPECGTNKVTTVSNNKPAHDGSGQEV